VFFWPIIYGRLLKAAGAVRALVESREDQGFNWGRHEYALLRLTRRLPDRIICVSEAVRRVMLEREAVEPQRTTVVHNGIDLPTAGASKRSETRRALGFGPDDFVVGMVANLNRAVKGVGYFVSAMPGILGAVPSARFLIVGGGPDEAALRTQAERLGVEDRVRFAGFQSEVASYYDAMDISVLTSLSEGLSITLLESMGRGLPVVVTRVGGNPEVVRDGETGFLVPARDVEAFTARVVALARDPSLRLRLGNAGRATITRSFSRADAAARYARVYEEVLR
jgi:glycosyltransferase involved in cell wall biosynthesis